jgi:hypothetical protein
MERKGKSTLRAHCSGICSARGRYFGSDKFLDPVRPYRSFSSARSRFTCTVGRKCIGRRNAEIRKKRARASSLRFAKRGELRSTGCHAIFRALGSAIRPAIGASILLSTSAALCIYVRLSTANEKERESSFRRVLLFLISTCSVLLHLPEVTRP